MKKMLLLLAGVMLFPSFTFAEDIQTVDGTVYKDITVEGVNPSGIDIGYTDANGSYILRGLKFTNLPADIQKRFGYVPVASQQFESKVNQYSSSEMEDVAGTEKARLEAIKKEVQQKLAGADIKINPADLRYAVFALRRLVKIKSVGPIQQGCVVEVQEVTTGKPIKSARVLLDGVNLPPDDVWTGYIYPTGAQATYQKVSGIPVFTESVNRSVDIINKYLNIYGEYAASMNDQNNTPPQDIPAPDQDSSVASGDNSSVSANISQPADSSSVSSGSSQQDQQDQQSSADNNNFNYVPDDGYGYTYSVGGSYYPVNWYWHHHNRPHPRPTPRPGPKPVYNNNANANTSNFNNRINSNANISNFDNRINAYEQSINRQESRSGAIPNAGGGQRNYGQSSNRVGNFHQAYSGGGSRSGGGFGGRSGGGGGGRR